jgi:uncharacterized Fe-S cluster-containing radical SAM superfamily protein
MGLLVATAKGVDVNFACGVCWHFQTELDLLLCRLAQFLRCGERGCEEAVETYIEDIM